MRQAFIQSLCRLAAKDDRIVLLTGDLGFMAMEPFRDRFPGRFVNAGVAEQNMIGLATGLAEAGLKPYVYSIAPFAALRPFEFIRNGPVLHNLPVRVVGMGAGFDYGHAGPTHYSLEDIGTLRTLPGLTIVVPADSGQAEAAILATVDHPGPVYYSLGKDDKVCVRGLDGRFRLGRLEVIRRGQGVAIFATGSLSVEAVAAADLLAAQGVLATLAIVSSYNPDADEDVAEVLDGVSVAVSVEAQTISGGLAAFVGSVIATRGIDCQLRPLAVLRSPDGTSGSQAERWRTYRLDSAAIVHAALHGPGTGGRA